jgi:hypothetical protein
MHDENSTENLNCGEPGPTDCVCLICAGCLVLLEMCIVHWVGLMSPVSPRKGGTAPDGAAPDGAARAGAAGMARSRIGLAQLSCCQTE